MEPGLRIGTCTWNYPSWVGLVYSKEQRTAAAYLPEYSKHYTTAEIDSWFYRIPTRKDVLAYKAAVDDTFRFTCKVPQDICLTHLRKKNPTDPLVANPNFLSIDLFNRFLDTISPLVDQMDAIMFEFEYLNKDKMASLAAFIDRLGSFIIKLPKGLPYALEPRNQNYLKKPYFQFIAENGLIHVLVEKEFMPPVPQVFAEFEQYFGDRMVVRLMGGKRQEIEAKTGDVWNKIVDAKPGLADIIAMIHKVQKMKYITVNVNNHYEGSAPLTIEKIMKSHD